ncbi:MAG: glycoside hydrolase family 3 C-terminal domain-containing protein [Bacteroidetes bacterium]|nr:glycoside hydrolase family 3 C-terminal domain-containing protein [Bacteroidota bacterium]
MKRIILSLLFLALYLTSFSQNLTIDEKVDSLLNLMTIDEKIGQMAQAERGMLENINDISTYALGSLLSGGGSSPNPNTQAAWAGMYDNFQSIALQSRLGIPLIYGVDAVHGHNNVYGAVIFPHNIGLGCTWNPNLVKSINAITAKEVAATGIDWTFAPCIAVPRDERWGRTYEGFGETAEIQQIMAQASVLGLQGDDLSAPESILACAKHFVGDGGTTGGDDQGNTELLEQVLRDVHMAGYIDAIDAGVGSIMASFNSWNGQKLHGHEYLLTDVLKNELGFEGFIVSDWKGVDQVAGDYREAIKRSINAGIDMVMVPDRYIYFISILKDLVESNEVSQERIDDAVRRILKQKFLLNLFEKPLTDPDFAADFGSQAHRDTARKAVRESLILLNAKNDVLPLHKNNQRILVAGNLANDLGALCGGWSISWQGSNGAITEGTNILNGLQQATGNSEIIYSQSGDISDDIDVAVVVIGENPYAEGNGDRENLYLNDSDINLIKKVKGNGIPVIAVLVSGRPLIISDILPYTDAFIAAWLPGSEGGDGIADILFGEAEPSGKLSISWPKDMYHFPVNFGAYNYNPLYAYKHGFQGFPSHNSSSAVSPYAAKTEDGRNSIRLVLNDFITAVDVGVSDFQLKLGGSEIPAIISDVEISAEDASVLIISLNTSLGEGDASLSYSGNGIFAADLALETFDDFYIYNNASTGGEITHLIPGKIQAEDYATMFGIDTETCTDQGGGLSVGWIDPNDWMKYNVEIMQSGEYAITSRIAGYATGSFSLRFDETAEAIVQFESTEGWQNWEDFATNIYLPQGNYTMTFTAHNDAFNVNYFDFDLIDGISEGFQNVTGIRVSPNPISSGFQLKYTIFQASDVSIKLFDMTGHLVQAFFEGKNLSGLQKFQFQIDSSLKRGMYFIEVKDENKRYFEKVMIE